ncbi:Ig domain-containing protein, partial [Accumulibacter sp.]|uniref:Ig domain-containing protein n=1 Tax=Accumulibacter sp. TaxID=2053492 RepID=UPI0025CFDF5F
VAGVPGQWQTVTVDRISGRDNGRDEFGLYRADDADGRIGELKPGDAGYAAAALTSERVVVLFGSGPNGGARPAVQLPASEYIGFYRIVDGSTSDWRSQNPLNVVGRGPLAVFSVSAADSNLRIELRADADGCGCLCLSWGSSSNATGTGSERVAFRIGGVSGGVSAAPQRFRYQARARDEDGDPLLYRLLEGPTGASIDAGTGLLSWDDPQAGSHFFRIEVDDGKGGRVEQSFTVCFTTRTAEGQIGSRAGITAPRGLPTASAATIDWSGKSPSCFSGARLTPRSWLGDFLGVPSAGMNALDSPALRIRIER